jgi:hypothetical protein
MSDGGRRPPLAAGQAVPADKFLAEFSHDELFDFFTKIEQVQAQLDSVS